MLSCPHIIFSEFNRTYHTSPSCYYVLDLLCVKYFFKSDNFLLNLTWHRFFVAAVWRWPESYSSCGVGIGKKENISLAIEKII